MVRRKGLKARLAQISPMDWATFFLAIGTLRAAPARIRAALELGRRLVSTMPHEQPFITSLADAANLVISEMSLLDRE